jgi:tetratricopeptide (TPR) repeat protein
MNPILVLSLSLAAPGEPDVRPAVPLERVPATDSPQQLDALARYGRGRMAVMREQLPAAAKDLEAAAAADPQAVAPRRDLVGVYVDLGREAAAIRMAREVLAADPADADTAHTLARLLFAAKRHAEAGDALAAVTDSPRLAKRPTKRLAILRDLARCRVEAGDAAAAADAWQSMKTFLDHNREALLTDGFTPRELDLHAADTAEQLGQARIRQNQYDAAATAFRLAHRLYAQTDPASAARLDWNLSSVLQAKGDAAAALAHLEAYLARKPVGVEPYERYAELLRQLGRGHEVVAALSARAAANPQNAAIRWLAAVEQLRTNFTAGHAEVRRLMADSTDPAFYRAAVRGYAAANRPRELILLLDERFAEARPTDDDEDTDVDRSAAGERARLLSEAVAAESQLLPALLTQAGASQRPETIELLAWQAERTGRLDQAERLLRAAVHGPAGDRPTVPYALLRLLHQQRRWEDLIDECDAGLQRRKAYFFYTFMKAEAEAELGRGREALATIDRIARDASFHSRRQKARVLGILGHYTEMAAECLATMREFPAADEVQMMRYLLADAYLGLRQFDKAEAELRKILEDDPDDALALNNLGYNLADQGRKLDEAEALIRRAIELDQDERARLGLTRLNNAAYLDSLGWVLFRKGKLDEARQFLEQAASLPDGAGDPNVWDHLGDVYFRLGNKDQARTAWIKAARLYEGTHQGRQFGRLDEVKRKLKLP